MKPVLLSIPDDLEKWVSQKLSKNDISSIQSFVYVLMRKEKTREQRKINRIKGKQN